MQFSSRVEVASREKYIKKAVSVSAGQVAGRDQRSSEV